MIATTLGALVQAEAALTTLCALKLSAKSAYHLKKLAALVTVELKHYHAERDQYIRTHGTPREDGSVTIGPHADAWPAFVAQMNDLAAVPVEIQCGPITLAMIGDEKVCAADLLALGPLVADDEERNADA
jgi:hypothetical protein